MKYESTREVKTRTVLNKPVCLYLYVEGGLGSTLLRPLMLIIFDMFYFVDLFSMSLSVLQLDASTLHGPRPRKQCRRG